MDETERHPLRREYDEAAGAQVFCSESKEVFSKIVKLAAVHYKDDAAQERDREAIKGREITRLSRQQPGHTRTSTPATHLKSVTSFPVALAVRRSTFTAAIVCVPAFSARSSAEPSALTDQSECSDRAGSVSLPLSDPMWSAGEHSKVSRARID